MHTRNNLLQRFTATKWGATPQVMRTSGLVLVFTTGEFACPVWDHSTHAKLVDTSLSETCWIITSCLKLTPVKLLFPLAGMAPPDVRRAVASSCERLRMEDDTWHPLYGHKLGLQRLKSQKSFIKCVDPSLARCNLWWEKVSLPDPFFPHSDNLPSGHQLPWPVWKSLNRLWTQVGRSKDNMFRWGFSNNSNLGCMCRAVQTMAHFKSSSACPATCSQQDLLDATKAAVHLSRFWAATF